MVNKNIITTKLAELEDRVDRVRQHCPVSADQLAADRDARELVAFNLMLAVQSCLDIASHIIADEGWPVATTLAESFARLAEHSVIDTATASALARAAGLRTLVARGYAGVDLVMLHQAAAEGPSDLDEFAKEIGTWLASSPAA